MTSGSKLLRSRHDCATICYEPNAQVGSAQVYTGNQPGDDHALVSADLKWSMMGTGVGSIPRPNAK